MCLEIVWVISVKGDSVRSICNFYQLVLLVGVRLGSWEIQLSVSPIQDCVLFKSAIPQTMGIILLLSKKNV